MQELRQKFIVFKKPGVLSKKMKSLTPTTIESNIFCWNFAYVCHLPISTEGGSDFLKFV